MKNREIAEIFDKIATLLEIKGDIVFKIRAYQKAAENIAGLAEDIETLKNEDRLSQIPGIGQALREKITEYCATGRISAYDELIKEIPESLLELTAIPSVGPKKVKLFYEQLGIKDTAGLRAAAEAGQLLGLPGIKEKTVENILGGLKIVKEGQERMNLGTATAVADGIIAALRAMKEVKQISPAGSLRRQHETVRDIDILVVSSHPAKVMETFVHLPQVKKINGHGETKSSILTQDNVQVDLRVVPAESFGAALLYFTGSKNFNVRLRQVAMKKDMKVNEYGIYKVKGEQETLVASKTEKECLQALGLPYVPPELRDDVGEEELFDVILGRSLSKKLPALIELADIQGDLHVHSTYSDGRDTIAVMAETARQRGYQYLAVSDHSPRLRVAGGVSPEDLKKKKQEIDRLNAGYQDFRILFGTEVEIDMDGNLDYNNRVLSEFDIVIAAVHSGFEQSRDKMTKRISKACQHKYVHVIAHPTGVHLGKREPYDIDFKEICKAAVDANTCLEINSFPVRLDLNAHNVYFARRQGVRFAINTDSHRKEHMDYLKFGVAIARRGWLASQDVLNTLSLKELLRTLKK